MNTPFLVYWFQEMEFRFMGDHVIIEDHATHKKYKIVIKRHEGMPILISEVEK